MYRYRQADMTPYLYQTNDYGKTWKRIADGKNGIPAWHFTRVVREDPASKGLLYAGTEFGLYASFDDGAHWQPFQLNLPITPVTDLMIYRDDLIVTTQGRGFYILSNMAPLRTVKAGMTHGGDSLQAGGRLSRRRGDRRRTGAVVLLLAPRRADVTGNGRGSRRQGHVGRDVDGAARHRADSRSWNGDRATAIQRPHLRPLQPRQALPLRAPRAGVAPAEAQADGVVARGGDQPR